jgi:predicted RNase H-like nuclease (RuvC/YqgF family)
MRVFINAHISKLVEAAPASTEGPHRRDALATAIKNFEIHLSNIRLQMLNSPLHNFQQAESSKTKTFSPVPALLSMRKLTMGEYR